jgi:hypothetical protein
VLSMHTARSAEICVDGERHSPVEFRICSSCSGFYVGTYCDGRGPLSRESEYYKRRRDIERDLRNHTVRWRR